MTLDRQGVLHFATEDDSLAYLAEQEKFARALVKLEVPRTRPKTDIATAQWLKLTGSRVDQGALCTPGRRTSLLPVPGGRRDDARASRTSPPPNFSVALAANLAAHRIFLAIERALFAAGDVAAVGCRHAAFFVTDGAVFAVQVGAFAR